MDNGIRNPGNPWFDICMEGAEWISETDKTARAWVTINGKTEWSVIKFSLSLGRPFTILEREDELEIFHPQHVRYRRGQLDSLLRQHLRLNTLDWIDQFHA